MQRQLPCPGGKKRRADESEGAAAASVGADSKGSKKRDRNKHQGGDDVKKEVKRMRLSPGFRPEHYCTFIGGALIFMRDVSGPLVLLTLRGRININAGRVRSVGVS